MDEHSAQPQSLTQNPIQHLKRILFSSLVSAGFGFAVWIAFDYFELANLMTYTFLIWVPLSIGAIAVQLSGFRKYFSRLFLPLLSIIILLFIVSISGVDRTICLVILAAPMLVGSLVGGLLMAGINKLISKDPLSVFLIAVFPLVSGPLESTIDGTYMSDAVITTIEVNAEKEEVWESITRVENIREEELPWTFSHTIGIPTPRHSVLDREEVGGIREIRWNGGIRFEEHITEWEEGKGFSYRFVLDSNNLPLYALDKHIRAGGQYFDVLDGSYELQSLPGNRTRITLCCRYRLTTRFNWYARWWVQLFLNDFQRSILTVVKGRVENVGK